MKIMTNRQFNEAIEKELRDADYRNFTQRRIDELERNYWMMNDKMREIEARVRTVKEMCDDLYDEWLEDDESPNIGYMGGLVVDSSEACKK